MSIAPPPRAATTVQLEPSGELATPTATSSRHPGDLVRIGVGIAVFLLSLLAIDRDQLSRFEVDVFRVVNDLPDPFSVVLGPVMQAGNVVATAAAALLALVFVRRYRRISFDIAASGVLAWFAAKGVKALVERPRPGGLIDDVARIAGTDGLGFVSGHTAVATAIVAAASPYLPRPVRRAAWALPLTVGLARIYYGAHLPLDIVGGAALGWIVAASIHLLLGAPRRMPTPSEAESVLRAAGVPVSDVARLDTNARGSLPFLATIGGETRFVKLLDPEPRDRDWVYRAGRFLAFREVRDEAAVADPATQAYREAAMTQLARCAEAKVPTIKAIESHRGRMWLVEDRLAGSPLDRLSPEALTDEVLEAVWRQISLVHEARIAHRDLVAGNILVDGSDVWIVDFAHAKTATRQRSLDNDVAEFLVTTALLVGPERAAVAAARVIGRDRLAAAVPELQPFVVTAENRERLRRQPSLLAELRDRTAEHAGLAPPTPSPELPGVGHQVTVLALAGAATAGLVAFAGMSAVVDVLSTPGYRWLGVALVCGLLLPITTSARLLASIDRRLALGRTAGEVIAFHRRSTLRGRDDGRDALIAGLGRAGVSAQETTAALARSGRVLGVVALVGVVLLGGGALVDGRTVELPSDAAPLALMLGLATAVEAILAYRGHRPVAADGVIGAKDTRPDLAVTITASVVEVVLGVVAVVSVALAFGGGAPLLSIGTVAAAFGLWSRLGPVLGAPGTGPVLLAFGLAAAGMPLAVAAATALVSQVFLVWLPVMGGMVRSLGGDRW